jgi:hypothetical protein
VASPLVAATYALAGKAAAGSTPAAFPYAASLGSLTDVTNGSNGSCGGTYLCTAGVGYDGPTGRGTPNGALAFAAATTPSPAPVPAPTPTPPTAAPPAQLLGNEGFETGSPAPWTASAGVIDKSTAQPAHTGSWKAWLGGYGITHTDTLTQTVTIPATAGTATLSYWLHVATAETTATTVYDKLTVQLVSSTGAVLATPGMFSNVNRNTGYTQKVVDVSKYKGQKVTLRFTATENGSRQTSFVVDDTALTVG